MTNLIKKFSRFFDKITGLEKLDIQCKKEEEDIKRIIKKSQQFREDYQSWLSDNGINIRLSGF